MKTIYPLIFLCMLAACNQNHDTPEPTPNPGPEPSLTVSASTLDFLQPAQTSTFEITATHDWTAVSSDSWISLSPSSGTSGTAHVTVTATENEATSPRTAQITVSMEALTHTISVSQAQKDALSVTPTSLTPSCDGGQFVVTVTSNLPYTVSINQAGAAWIRQTGTQEIGTQGTATQEVSFTIEPLRQVGTREDLITFSYGNLSQTVTVSQTKQPDTPGYQDGGNGI